MRDGLAGWGLKTGALLTAGGVALSWACCVLPIGLGVLGTGAASLGLKLAPYRPYLLGLTALFLGGAFYFAYRPLPKDCDPERACAAGSFRRRQRIILWLVTVVTLILVSTPHLAGWWTDLTL